MHFFTALDGSLYPVSAIERIGAPREVTFQPLGNKGKVHQVHLKGGDTAEITTFELDSLKERAVQMIPALPGTRLLHWDDGDNSFFGTAVVGWAYTTEGLFYPVTADGINDGSIGSNFDMEMHDGTVVRPADCRWNSLEEWQETMKKGGR